MFDGGSTATPIDIEELLQWAMDQPVYRPWRGVSERALMFDHGYDAIPKGCAGLYAGGDTLLRNPEHPDAVIIIAALNGLDGWTRSLVRINAREKRRPDCMLGVEARLVPIRKRSGKKHRKVVVGHRWQPCHPQAICAAREIYARWHAALTRLGTTLKGRLTDWSITGFSAPAKPWETGLENSA